MDEVENSAFLRAQTKLDSEYKRTKHVRENMKYIATVEVLLNKEDVRRGEKKEVFGDVSVVEMFWVTSAANQDDLTQQFKLNLQQELNVWTA